jgi:hypothetical protein
MNEFNKIPKELTPILLILSWMTYRILGFIYMPSIEVFGGDVLPTAWIIPLGQDALIGLTAPIVVYLLATRPKTITYAMGLAWVWWGIADFGVGLVTEIFQPPFKSPMGENTPSFVLTGWLLTNLSLEIYAFYLLLTPKVRNYFIVSEKDKPLNLEETALSGKWIFAIVAAALTGLFFPIMAMGINTFFKMMGY